MRVTDDMNTLPRRTEDAGRKTDCLQNRRRPPSIVFRLRRSIPGKRGLGACLLVLLLAAALSAAGCRSEGRDRSGEQETPEQTLTVFAAASLAEAFAQVARAFEAEQPGVRVALSVAGSQQLAQQLALGAPADVFASADSAQMQVAVESGRVAAGAARVFARNRLVLITPKDSPVGIEGLADLARPGLRLVLADEAVPAGRYARRLLETASSAEGFEASFAQRALANVVSFEQNVRAVQTKVALGEADAGLVYATDAAGKRGEHLRTHPIPDALNVTAAYAVAPVRDATHPALAAAFADFALSDQGQALLSDHGFLLAPEDANAAP